VHSKSQDIAQEQPCDSPRRHWTLYMGINLIDPIIRIDGDNLKPKRARLTKGADIPFVFFAWKRHPEDLREDLCAVLI
jgi:hypothetical protein